MTRHRDQVAYGRPVGRPRVAAEVEAVSATIPRADADALTAVAAVSGLKRTDILREAVICYLRHHHQEPQR